MNSEWRSLLESYGADLRDSTVHSFGDPGGELRLLSCAAIRCDLSHYGLIRLQGPDAVQFMQGQFTNDARQVSAGRSQLSALCSPKGRVLASFRIFRHGEAFYLRLPDTRSAEIARRLNLYVLRAAVSIHIASDDLARFGVAGAGCVELLSPLVAAIPEQANDAIEAGGVSVVRTPGEVPRFEIYGKTEKLSALWRALETAQPVGADAWSLLDIEAGIPEVFTETSDTFVPQMINLDTLHGVSFTKGCYTGQEVVARTQYLGRLKRRMYRASMDSSEVLAAGTPIYCSEAPGDEPCGIVVIASPAPQGGCKLLAVLRIESAELDEPLLMAGSQTEDHRHRLHIDRR